MTDAEKFARAIQLTETNADPHAFGDAGQALTSYQVHPSWVQTWQHLVPLASVSNTWEQWVGFIVQGFYRHCVALGLTPVQAASYFHLGHIADDPEYEARFLIHWNSVLDVGDGSVELA